MVLKKATGNRNKWNRNKNEYVLHGLNCYGQLHSPCKIRGCSYRPCINVKKKLKLLKQDCTPQLWSGDTNTHREKQESN